MVYSNHHRTHLIFSTFPALFKIKIPCCAQQIKLCISAGFSNQTKRNSGRKK